MQTESTTEAQPNVTLPVLLGRVSEECNELALIADRLHSLASMVVAQSNSVEVITNLQHIDRLTQYLAAFAKLFASCARSTDQSWTLELQPLLADVTLGELVDRLSGIVREESEDDMDMF